MCHILRGIFLQRVLRSIVEELLKRLRLCCFVSGAVAGYVILSEIAHTYLWCLIVPSNCGINLNLRVLWYIRVPYLIEKDKSCASAIIVLELLATLGR